MPELSLIPRDYKKGKAGLESVLPRAGILVIILIVLSLLIYGGLFFYNRSLDSQLYELQGQVDEIDRQRDKEFEKEVVSLEKALKSLKIILRSHFYWSNLFSKLENLAVPLVSFSDFSGGIDKDGSISLLLSGKSSGYTYLAKQMASFNQEGLISETSLSGVELGTEGGIEFGLITKFLRDILLQIKE